MKDPSICALYVLLAHEMSRIKDLDAVQYVSRVDGFLNSSEIKGFFNKLTNFYPEKHISIKYITLYLTTHKKL